MRSADDDARDDAGREGERSGGRRDRADRVEELRATVEALERELDRQRAEKQELVDRYERLLSTERRSRMRAEGPRAARGRTSKATGPNSQSDANSGLAGRVVERVRALLRS